AGQDIPRTSEAGISGEVLAFSAGLMIVTTALFSLVPALRAAATDPIESLKEGGRSMSRGDDRVRGMLAVAQITIGLVLLTAAEIMMATFLHLAYRDPGFRPDHLLTFNISLPGGDYKTERQIAFSDQLIERLRSVPGVTAAASARPLPLTGSEMTIAF